ncbi:MAG: hypothetical protein U1E45_15650 [Geminicoccaceae bacterium]
MGLASVRMVLTVTPCASGTAASRPWCRGPSTPVSTPLLEAEIAVQGESEARDAAAAYAPRVHRRTGLTQAAFAARIGVPLDTNRNWEQGKCAPAGPARAPLRILDRVPVSPLAALEQRGT